MLIAHPDARSIPYSFDGRAYERKDSTTSLMPRNKYQQLLLSKNLNPTSWESQTAIGVSIEDLDHDEIFSTLNDITRKKRLESSLENDGVESILKRLKLIETTHLTNAAVVLFSKEIPGDYLQCVVRMARFRGTEKGKMARIDEPEYPFEAVREALINAICHRDYASPGGSITITIYDDRLEIANTGILPSDITLDDLKTTHISHPRNPRITNLFFRRGFIEAMGIGTQEILQSCMVAKMQEPDFYEQAGAFVVRLWSSHYQAPLSSEMGLSVRQKNILRLLEEKALAPHEMLDELKEDISARTLGRDLQDLKKKGYLESEGQGKKARWFLGSKLPRT